MLVLGFSYYYIGKPSPVSEKNDTSLATPFILSFTRALPSWSLSSWLPLEAQDTRPAGNLAGE